MTIAQERAIEKFKEKALSMYGYPETKELKRFEIIENTELDYVSVSLEVGLIGDEGTMAAVICRHSYLVSVGKRGGYYGFRKSGKRVAYESVLRAVIYSDLDKR